MTYIINTDLFYGMPTVNCRACALASLTFYILFLLFLSILICYVWLLPMTMPNGCDKTGAMLQGEGVRGRDPGNRLHKTEMQTKTLTPMYVCT